MRVLIVRFSSFGDIFQALEAAAHVKRSLDHSDPGSKVAWLTRSDFADLLRGQTSIQEVISLDRKTSVFGLIRLAWSLSSRFDCVYDAHSNLRSLVVRSIIRLNWLLTGHWFNRFVLIRPKSRLRRFLFFRLRLPTLPTPFKGAHSFLWPLQAKFKIEMNFTEPTWASTPLSNPKFLEWKSKLPLNAQIIAFAPSAAWPNKRWPIQRWSELAEQLIKEPSSVRRFLLLGGPDDRFLQQIADRLPVGHALNLAGQISLLESAQALLSCQCLVANDTGLLHVADRIQLPNVAIIGPTAFGYTSGPLSSVAEVDRADLPCKPCSKDGRDACTNPIRLKCLEDVRVSHVASMIEAHLKSETRQQ